MSAPLPLSAFPIGAPSGKAAGFVLAVVVGLAFFMAARAKAGTPQQTTTPRTY